MFLDMTELSEHIHSGKGAEGHQSETSNNCVPFFEEDPGQGRDLKSDHVRFS